MATIREIGVLCSNCNELNDGTSEKCSHCGERLIGTRPLTMGGTDQWVVAQLGLRKRLGIGRKYGRSQVEISLRTWAKKSSPRTATSQKKPVPAPGTPAHVGGQQTLPSSPDSERSVRIVRAVCPSCEANYDDEVKFCSVCGTETVAPDTADQVYQVERSLQLLNQRIHKLERDQRIHSIKHAPRADRAAGFNWVSISNTEKWKVAWGVFGRTIVINIGLWVAVVAVFLFFGLIGSLAALLTQ